MVLFDGKTYRCKKISMPTRDENGGCSKFMTVSDTDYNFLKNNHRNLYNMCNSITDQSYESIVTVMKAVMAGKIDMKKLQKQWPPTKVIFSSSGVLKPFQSGFQNEYVKVKKQIGSGYILVSGLLMLYLVHRLFNRK